MNRRPFIVIPLAACAGAAFAQAAAGPTAGAPAFKVGDTWRWVRSDRRTKLQEAETRRTVTAVSATRIEGTENAGRFVMTPDWSIIEAPDYVRLDDGAKFIAFPLEVGKKWSFQYEQHNKNNAFKGRFKLSAEVVGAERVSVPAGEFDTFKIVTGGFIDNLAGGGGRLDVITWYAPAARATVRTWVDSGINKTETALVELKLQA